MRGGGGCGCDGDGCPHPGRRCPVGGSGPGCCGAVGCGWVAAVVGWCRGRLRATVGAVGCVVPVDVPRADRRSGDAPQPPPRRPCRSPGEDRGQGRRSLGDALAAGEIAGEHVDAVTAELKDLTPPQQALLAGKGEQLALAAANSTPDEFRRQVAKIARQLCADDGMAKLERQQRAVRLRAWFDHVTGMLRLSGEFDPETGLLLMNRLNAQIETLFHDRTPDLCPDDPSARQDFLRAHALLDLTAGGGWGGVADGDVDRHRLRHHRPRHPPPVTHRLRCRRGRSARGCDPPDGVVRRHHPRPLRRRRGRAQDGPHPPPRHPRPTPGAAGDVPVVRDARLHHPRRPNAPHTTATNGNTAATPTSTYSYRSVTTTTSPSTPKAGHCRCPPTGG